MTRQIGPQRNAIVSKLLVSPLASDGYYTTIGSALAAAVAGDTIVIKDGTYTENLTLKTGVNFASACGNDQIGNGNVTIIGKAIDNGAAVNSIFTGITFQTNGDYVLDVTGGSGITLDKCFIDAVNSTAIHMNNNSGNVYLLNSDGDIGGASGSLFDVATGDFWVFDSQFSNTANSTKPSTIGSAGGVLIAYNSQFSFSTSCSGSASLGTTGFNTIENCDFNTALINSTAITTAGIGTSCFINCRFSSGSASAISVGAGTTVKLFGASVDSTNTNVITGAGTINYGLVLFTNTSNGINTSSQVPIPLTSAQGGDASNASFFAYQATSTTNATGDGTVWQLGTSALTEKFDTGSNFNTNGTFTAPVAGIYQLAANATVSNLAVGHTDFEIYITASGVNYNGLGINPFVCQSGVFSAISQGCSCLVSMAAGDTAVANVVVANSTKTVTVNGSASPNTYFYGYLVV